MKKLIGVILIAFLASCKDVAVTDTEIKAVDSVLKIYGGECGRSKGDTQINGMQTRYFMLEMSDSKILEGLKQISELPASNIAYTFYMNLNQEQKNYTDIKVNIKFKDGQLAEFLYPVKDIIEADKFKSVLTSLSNKVQQKDYNGLYAMFDTIAIPELTVDKLSEFCYQNDSAFGEVESIQFVGFSFFKGKKGGNLVHLGGVNKRAKGNMPINIIADRQSKKVMSLKFEF